MTDTIETPESVFEAKARDLLLDAFTKNGAEERDGTITFEFKIADLQSAIAAALEAERLEERERCAVTFDEYYRQHVGIDDRRAQAGSDAAAAIRSRETENG